MHQMNEGGSVIVTRQGAIATVTLNEPKSLNALSPGIKAGLEANLPALAADPGIRAIVITGEGRGFCAGGDIRAMDDRDAGATRERMARNYSWMLPLLTAPKPVITAINGVAAGAGLSLALAGDIIVASHAARFKAGFPGLGLAPDLALAYTLPRAVGMVRAKDILLTNREIGAEEALAIGLVSRLVAPEALMAEALAIANDLGEGPTVSFGLTKMLLLRAYELPLDGFLEAEAEAQITAFASADLAEGVEAFRARRKPDFKGR